jgi:hypothetical protein
MAALDFMQDPRRFGTDLNVQAIGRRAGVALFAVSAVLSMGRLFDIGVLWIAQRQNTPQWEFMALSNSLDVMPGLVLAVGVAYCALQVMGSTSMLGYRVLAAIMILLGVASAGIGVMLATDYFAMLRYADARAIGLLRSTAFRGMVLSGLFFLLLIPAGVFAFTKPKLDGARRARR